MGCLAKCRDYEREDETDNCPTVTVSKISIAPDGTMSQTFEVNGEDLYDKKTICKTDDGQWLG